MTNDGRNLRRRLRRFCAVLTGIGVLLVMVSASASAAAGHWYVNGEAVGVSPIEVAGVNQGAFNFGYVEGGVKFNAKCPTVSAGGMISNPAGESSGILTGGSLVLSGCAVTEPAGKGCTVSNSIEFQVLLGQIAESAVKFWPESGETFFVLRVSGCTVTALNGEKVMKGIISAKASVSTPGTYEFTRTSGSGMIFGGQAAYLLGNYTLADLAGDPATVGP